MLSSMKKKRILLGVTGSIAAYKAPDLIRRLKEQAYEVRVVLTAAGKAFVTPLSLQAVSQHKVYELLMDVEAEAAMSHIDLARWPDYILLAPASADFIAKLAHGFADELLSSLCLAASSHTRFIIVPAMNQAMWSNSATQDNVNTLKERGYLFLGPAQGIQACGDVGLGRMLEPKEIVDALSKVVVEPYLQGQKVLITAGPTREPIDPVRYLSNRSSGKMGFALAEAAVAAGAKVTLISGPVALPPPKNLTFIAVTTAVDMLLAVQREIAGQTVFISAAAVADYQVINPAPQKLKKSGSLAIQLKPSIDILATVSQMPLEPRPLLVGFAAETENTLKFAEEKRRNKNIDIMIVNDVSQAAIGFDSDDNEVIVLSSDLPIHLACAPKKVIAQQLLQIMAGYLTAKKSTEERLSS